MSVGEKTPKTVTLRGRITTPDRISKIATDNTRIQLIPFGSADQVQLVIDARGTPQYGSSFANVAIPENGALTYQASVPPGQYVLAVVNVDLSKVGGAGVFPPPPVVLAHKAGQYVTIRPGGASDLTLDLGDLIVEMYRP
jgi:hypothetical protein